MALSSIPTINPYFYPHRSAFSPEPLQLRFSSLLSLEFHIQSWDFDLHSPCHLHLPHPIIYILSDIIICQILKPEAQSHPKLCPLTPNASQPNPRQSHQFCLPNALSHIPLPTTITLAQATSLSHPDPCKIFLRVLSASILCPTWKTKWTLIQKMNFIPWLTPCSDTSLHSKQNANFSHDQQGHGWLMCPVQLHPGAYFLLTIEILWRWTHWFHRCTDLVPISQEPLLSSYPLPGWPLALPFCSQLSPQGCQI